jgi:hypothetical protein
MPSSGIEEPSLYLTGDNITSPLRPQPVNATPCDSCKIRRFGGVPYLHHQDNKIPPARNNVNSNEQLKLVDCCQFNDVGDTFLRNISSYKSHTA